MTTCLRSVGRQPDPDVSGPFDFYAFGPEAPANARACRPRPWTVARTTTDAQWLLRAWDSRGIRIKERANHRALVVLLASELYRRDHGTDPPSDEALVGPYLEELPDDGFGDAGDAPGPAGRECGTMSEESWVLRWIGGRSGNRGEGGSDGRASTG